MKLTIVINGMGGVGKDTLCRFAAERYKTENISSITPIKELAMRMTGITQVLQNEEIAAT